MNTNARITSCNSFAGGISKSSGLSKKPEELKKSSEAPKELFDQANIGKTENSDTGLIQKPVFDSRESAQLEAKQESTSSAPALTPEQVESKVDQGVEYVIAKTDQRYPGFANNGMGVNKKSGQVRSHLNDFCKYLKKNNVKVSPDMSSQESKDLKEAGTMFVADTIADEYHMGPVLSRTPMFLSPISANVSDFVDFLTGTGDKQAMTKAEEATAPVKPDADTQVPFDRHVDGAVKFIIDKTDQRYPGFANTGGVTRKEVQIRSHLKDFGKFVQEKMGGNLTVEGKEQKEQLVKDGANFVADKTAEEYGMQPHMSRNPMLMSPIISNVSDYVDYLGEEGISLQQGGNGMNGCQKLTQSINFCNKTGAVNRLPFCFNF